MSNRPPLPIQRGDIPDKEVAERRRSALDRAKARARAQGEKPGDMHGVPSFDDVRQMPRLQPAPGQDAPPTLSPGTAKALEAVAQANQVAAAAVVTEERATQLDAETISDLLGVDVGTAEKVRQVLYPSGDVKDPERVRTEARISSMDIGEFLANGTLTQQVQIIPAGEGHKGLTVTFQTVPDAVEALVDRLLAEDATRIRKVRDGETFIESELSHREYVRKQNEYALAAHVVAWNGERRQWPTLVDSAGRPDEKAMATRFTSVQQIASPLFHLVIKNLSWFLERVQDTINVAVLGNG